MQRYIVELLKINYFKLTLIKNFSLPKKRRFSNLLYLSQWKSLQQLYDSCDGYNFQSTKIPILFSRDTILVNNVDYTEDYGKLFAQLQNLGEFSDETLSFQVTFFNTNLKQNGIKHFDSNYIN